MIVSQNCNGLPFFHWKSSSWITIFFRDAVEGNPKLAESWTRHPPNVPLSPKNSNIILRLCDLVSHRKFTYSSWRPHHRRAASSHLVHLHRRTQTPFPPRCLESVKIRTIMGMMWARVKTERDPPPAY